MIKLENKYLQVKVSEQGAELQSVVNKITGIEHLWQADPTVWPWHAPNLFPVVGSCYNDQILIGDEAYPISRHGFARTSKFALIISTEDHAVFSLSANQETLKHYPYNFEYQVIYDLINKRLRVSYKVINKQNGDILFSLGAHPAFRVPFFPDENYTDYYVEFAAPAPAKIHLLTKEGLFNGETKINPAIDNQIQLTRSLFFSLGAHPAFRVPFFPDENYTDYYVEFAAPAPAKIHLLTKEGLFNGETKINPAIDNQIQLTRSLFENDALVMKEIKSRIIKIGSRKNPYFVEVEFPEFPFVGIWAKTGGDFVCIEPWLGYADSNDGEKEFADKEAIHTLEQGHVFEAAFFIGFGEN